MDGRALIILAGILCIATAQIVYMDARTVLDQESVSPFDTPTQFFTLAHPGTVDRVVVTAAVNHSRFNRVRIHINQDTTLLVDAMGRHRITLTGADVPLLLPRNNVTIQVWQSFGTDPGRITRLIVEAETPALRRGTRSVQLLGLLLVAAGLSRFRRPG